MNNGLHLKPSLNPESWIPNPIFKDRLRANADLSKTNWFRVGGPAQWLFRPDDAADLAAFFALLPTEIPVTVLGVGSNLIVRDGGIDGVVIKLGRGFTECRVLSAENREESSLPTQHSQLISLSVGAGCLDVNVAQFALEHSVGAVEFLVGIPGTIGGAVRMNAGAYEHDISEILVDAEIVTRAGEIRTLSNAELGFVYRNSALPDGAVVTRATLRGKAADKAHIAQKMHDISTAREDTQPVRSRTGGSTFKNPEGHKAWALIDAAGCRGLRRGMAQVSEKHCNFLINTGGATAAELEALGEDVIARVKEHSGITLEWEIKRIGKKV
ncbi:MAG: UDP-N-acetylmuramate dehydrogenase [Alphaproteobacteria bacterium]|nr:UDP-N-acetylmuramate dehydrogenase [Alphaproteobacteria bacterium]